MHRSLRFIAALLLGAAVGCQNEGLSPAAVRPSFATGAASPTCAANPTVTVSDDTTLRAALKAAHPGDVIAVSGTIEVTADDTIATDNITLTCASPGSGLVARDRKSTRLNSSHLVISYAVFCLKKKNTLCLYTDPSI